MELLGQFMAYATTFRGGVNVSVANVSGDANKEIVVAPASGGGPNVKVYQYSSATGQFTSQDQFMAYSTSYRGGVELKLADLNNDGLAEIITAPTAGGPNVRMYSYGAATGRFALLDQFMAYDSGFRGGVNVEISNVDGDNYNEVVISPKANGGPNIRVYEYNSATGKMALLDNVMVYATNFRGAIQVKTADIDGSGTSELVVAPQTQGGPNVKTIDYASSALSIMKSFMAFSPAFRGGVNITTLY
jgi:hypothetical protein